MDALDYGRRFTIDGFRPNAVLATGLDELDAYLDDLHRLLEGERAVRVKAVYEDHDGISAGICGGEAHAVLHLFPSLRTISLQVFSRRDILLSDLTRALASRFGIGRFESHLTNATKAMPKQPEGLRSVIAGDRGYARVRLDESLLAAD